MEFIDQILRADEEAPRKQPHTAHRILAEDLSGTAAEHGGEATVRRYVCRCRKLAPVLDIDLSP